MRKIVRVYSLAQKKEWLRILNKFKKKDVFFFPEYAQLGEIHGDGKGQCFVYEEKDNYVLYVFLKRRINDLPFMEGETREYFDIMTPYGYTGPLCSTSEVTIKKGLLKGFFASFDQYCRQEKIVSEFIRFHPFLKTQNGCGPYLNPTKRCDNLYLDLTKTEEEIWQGYKPSRRNKIRQAKRNGLSIFGDEKLELMGKFVELYHRTMEKVKADDYFFFSNKYFMTMKNKLKDFSVLFFAKTRRGRIIAGSLFLCYDGYFHYFLSGSEKEFLKLRPNDWLLHQAALWAKRKGYQYLHYGGGAENVYQFKAGFSQDTAEYFIGKVVRNERAYQAISEKWKKHYPDKARVNISFFPLYRA